MNKGQTIVHRFEGGTLSGVVSFLCPPPGEWTLELQGAFFPRPGTMHAPQPADLKVSLHNEGECLGGRGTSFSLAAYETESDHYTSIHGLDRVSTRHLISALANRQDFRGLIVYTRRNHNHAPQVEKGWRMDDYDTRALLKAALIDRAEYEEEMKQLAQWQKQKAAAGIDEDDEQWESPKTHPLDAQFRVAVRGRLAELEISEASLAKLLGWDTKTLTDLLSTECPDVSEIEAVCGALGLATGFRAMPAAVAEDDADDEE